MKTLASTAFMVTTVLMAGCVSCLQPLYTDGDLAYDPDLIGAWAPADSKVTWEFTRADDRSYRLVHTDANGLSGQFHAHLFRIGETTFLDLHPESPNGTQNSLYAGHFQPMHSCFRVQQISPTLRVSALNLQWARDYLKAKPGSVQHVFTDRGVVLTAPTKELQAFLTDHCSTRHAWHDLLEMKRPVEH